MDDVINLCIWLWALIKVQEIMNKSCILVAYLYQARQVSAPVDAKSSCLYCCFILFG